MERHANVVGFDDAPFPPHRDSKAKARTTKTKVKVVGAVFAGARLDGVLLGEIERDGVDAADVLTRLVRGSKFAGHVRLVMLQGIALGGFNVVDVFKLHERTGCPVLVVSRKAPDYAAIRRALLERPIPEGARKWRIIEKLGPMEPLGHVHVQRVGLTVEEARAVLRRFTLHGHIPEPLRVAHLIATALAFGESRGRA